MLRREELELPPHCLAFLVYTQPHTPARTRAHTTPSRKDTHTMGALTLYGGGGPLAGLTVAQKRALAVS